MNTLSALIIFFGLVTWIIFSISVGIFAIVLTIKDGIIKRHAAIGLMLAIYGIPALLGLFYKAESTNKSADDFLGLGFGAIIIMIFMQVLVGYIAGEIIFRKKILRLIKSNK